MIIFSLKRMLWPRAVPLPTLTKYMYRHRVVGLPTAYSQPITGVRFRMLLTPEENVSKNP